MPSDDLTSAFMSIFMKSNINMTDAAFYYIEWYVCTSIENLEKLTRTDQSLKAAPGMK